MNDAISVLKLIAKLNTAIDFQESVIKELQEKQKTVETKKKD